MRTLIEKLSAIRVGDFDVNGDVISQIKYSAYRIRRLNVLLSRNDCCIDKKAIDELIQFIENLHSADGRNQLFPHVDNFELLANSLKSMSIVESMTLENDELPSY